jgi:hypothetical protein
MANLGESEPTSSPAPARLRVVDAEAARPASAPSMSRRHGRPSSFWIAGLLVLAVLGFSIGLGSTLARVRALEAENATLTTDLARARAALAAHKARLGEVRARVGELLARVGSLDALLATEPAVTVAPAPDSR